MTPQSKIITTAVLLVVLGGLGVADYYYGNGLPASISGSTSSEATESSTPSEPLPEGAVAKNNGANVEDVIKEQGLESKKSDELSLLAQVAQTTTLQNLAILDNGDRAGSVTVVETGNVKTDFIALKEALLSAFTPQMRDLRDETLQEPEKPVRNVLSFMDPGLSDEKIVIVRIRERLFEFHITEGKEEVMNKLIEALTNQ